MIVIGDSAIGEPCIDALAKGGLRSFLTKVPRGEASSRNHHRDRTGRTVPG